MTSSSKVVRIAYVVAFVKAALAIISALLCLSCRLSYPGLVYNLWPVGIIGTAAVNAVHIALSPAAGQITRLRFCCLCTRPGLSLGRNLSPLLLLVFLVQAFVIPSASLKRRC